jgi:hypothetical protein
MFISNDYVEREFISFNLMLNFKNTLKIQVICLYHV